MFDFSKANFRIWHDPMSGENCLRIASKGDDTGTTHILGPNGHFDHTPGTAVPEGSLFRSGWGLDKLQELFEELWKAGYRPADFKTQNPAQENHLADMRKLVSKALKVDL